MENKKVVYILVGVVAALCIVYIFGIIYQHMRPKYNSEVELRESMIASAEASVEASIAAEEKKREDLQAILDARAAGKGEEGNTDRADESKKNDVNSGTGETIAGKNGAEESREAGEASSGQMGSDEETAEAGDVMMPASLVAAAHDFAYEIRTGYIPDTYTEGDTTYTLSNYNFYGYSNGQDRWEALFKEKNKVYTFTGFIDTKLKVTPKVDTLAAEVGLDSSFYVLAEQEYNTNGQVTKQYHYRLNDKMQKEEVLYGYEYDYNNKGQKTEYRYYYNSNRSEGSNGLQLSQRTIYEYDEEGVCSSYREYKGDGTLRRTYIYTRDDSGRRSQKITSNAKGKITDYEMIYYDDLNAICKTVTSKTVTLYMNDDDGNHLVKAVYEAD